MKPRRIAWLSLAGATAGVAVAALFIFFRSDSEQVTKPAPRLHPAKTTWGLAVQLAEKAESAPRFQSPPSRSQMLAFSQISAAITSTEPTAPPARAFNPIGCELRVEGYCFNGREFDCQALFSCTLVNGLPYRARVRVISTKLVATPGGPTDRATVLAENLDQLEAGTGTLPLDGWVAFARDPLAYQNPADLAPLTTLPERRERFEQSFQALGDAADAARLGFRVKTEPFLGAFWRFTDPDQIDSAESALRALQTANEKLAAAITAKEYPAGFIANNGINLQKQLIQCKGENRWVQTALELLVIARRELGQCRRVPAGTDSVLGDTGEGWFFDSPAAAAEYVPLYERYQRQQLIR